MYYIHRLIYEEFNNITIPEGLVIMHTCNDSSCINPKHLKMGTNLDNINDSIKKKIEEMTQRVKRFIHQN